MSLTLWLIPKTKRSTSAYSWGNQAFPSRWWEALESMMIPYPTSEGCLVHSWWPYSSCIPIISMASRLISLPRSTDTGRKQPFPKKNFTFFRSLAMVSSYCWRRLDFLLSGRWWGSLMKLERRSVSSSMWHFSFERSALWRTASPFSWRISRYSVSIWRASSLFRRRRSREGSFLRGGSSWGWRRDTSKIGNPRRKYRVRWVQTKWIICSSPGNHSRVQIFRTNQRTACR